MIKKTTQINKRATFEIHMNLPVEPPTTNQLLQALKFLFNIETRNDTTHQHSQYNTNNTNTTNINADVSMNKHRGDILELCRLLLRV